MGSRGRSIRLRIYYLVTIPLVTMLGLFAYVAYTSVTNYQNLDRVPSLIRTTSEPMSSFMEPTLDDASNRTTPGDGSRPPIPRPLQGLEPAIRCCSYVRLQANGRGLRAWGISHKYCQDRTGGFQRWPKPGTDARGGPPPPGGGIENPAWKASGPAIKVAFPGPDTRKPRALRSRLSRNGPAKPPAEHDPEKWASRKRSGSSNSVERDGVISLQAAE